MRAVVFGTLLVVIGVVSTTQAVASLSRAATTQKQSVVTAVAFAAAQMSPVRDDSETDLMRFSLLSTWMVVVTASLGIAVLVATFRVSESTIPMERRPVMFGVGCMLLLLAFVTVAGLAMAILWLVWWRRDFLTNLWGAWDATDGDRFADTWENVFYNEFFDDGTASNAGTAAAQSAGDMKKRKPK